MFFGAGLIEYSCHEYLTRFLPLLTPYAANVFDHAKRVSCNLVSWHFSIYNSHFLILCLQTEFVLTKE